MQELQFVAVGVMLLGATLVGLVAGRVIQAHHMEVVMTEKYAVADAAIVGAANTVAKLAANYRVLANMVQAHDTAADQITEKANAVERDAAALNDEIEAAIAKLQPVAEPAQQQDDISAQAQHADGVALDPVTGLPAAVAAAV